VSAIKGKGSHLEELLKIISVHSTDPVIGYRYSYLAGQAEQLSTSAIHHIRVDPKLPALEENATAADLSKLYLRLDLALALANLKVMEKTIGKIELIFEEIHLVSRLRVLPKDQESVIIGDKTFRRHKNKNKKVGGLVASTARVTEFATISHDSVVLDHAVVRDAARLDDAVVKGRADVNECARLMRGVVIGGNSIVSSDIYNNTWIRGDDGVNRIIFKGNSFGLLNPEKA